MYKRLLSVLLTLCMIVSFCPVMTLAAETEELPTITKTYINPVYAGMIDIDTKLEVFTVLPDDEFTSFTSVEEAADYVRQCMRQRQTSIAVDYLTDSFDTTLLDAIMEAAVVHTGEPTEGDYLAYQYGGWNGSMGGYSSGGTYYLTLGYTITYYDNAAQEAQADAAVDALLKELNVDSLTTDYEKLKAVYDWMCDNISYDYTNLNNPSYMLKCTAYAALINRTAVCQGYANLLYRLALEMGIDCRIITGTGNGEAHAWNIVKLGGKYYNLDATWDINYRETDDYQYFLRGAGNFADHQRDAEFLSGNFNVAYPMSASDYDPSTAGTQEPTEPTPTEPEPTEPTEPAPTEPAPDIDFMHSGNLAVEKPSKQAIQEKYRSVTDWTDIYKEVPSVTAPYSAGALTDEFLNSGLTSLNYVRFVSGLPAVQLDGTMNEDAQHGVVVMAANNELSHRPSQPAGMDDAFYQRGYAATSSSNIGWGYSTLPDVVQGFMDDNTSASNLACLGHRRWLLNPTLLNVGFGYASASNIRPYAATKVFDRSGAAIDYDFISWPASGNFPTNLFDTSVPWSITLNPYKYQTPSLSQVKITITRDSDGKQWSFDASTGDASSFRTPYMTVDTTGYGVSNCIIFHPGSSNVDAYNGVYTVDVTGISYRDGSAATIRYQVDFFDADTCLEHSYQETVTAPTCEEQGYTTHTCTVCGDSFIDSYTDPTGHSYGEWYTVSEAACGVSGTQKRECTACGATETQTIPALEHSYQSVVTAPTCTAQGYTTHTCTVCGDSYVDSYVSATAHTIVTDPAVPATCTQNGLTEGSHCAVCGTVLVKQETVPGSHRYEAVVTAPTCTEDGYTTHICANCGDSYVSNQTAATDHSYGEWYTVTEATCTEGGVMRHDCTVCGEWETYNTGAIGHNFETTYTDPTCTESGRKITTCANCGQTYDVLDKEALGHSYTAVVTPPTYTEQGYTTYTCTRCGDSYVRDYVSPLEHNAVTDPAVAPTCTESGLTEGSHCADCGEILVKQEVIPATGHNYNSVVTEPTCTEGGYTTHTCATCGESYVDGETSAKGHSFGDWHTVTEATCTDEGTAQRDCACGHSETKSVPALGHSYESVVTAPTCEEQGYTTHTCSLCGESYVDSYVEALLHTYTDGEDTTCNNCGHEREIEEAAPLGDVDGSGSVDFFDGMIVLQYYAGLIDETALDVTAADVDNSGSIDFFDGMYILQYYAGILESLPVEG